MCRFFYPALKMRIGQSLFLRPQLQKLASSKADGAGTGVGGEAGDSHRAGSVHVLNIGCGDRYTLLDVVASLNEIMGTNVEAEHAEGRPGDVRHSHAAIDRAREVLGYNPLVDFKEGLRRTVEFFAAEE